jgi:hypothetical protein
LLSIRQQDEDLNILLLQLSPEEEKAAYRNQLFSQLTRKEVQQLYENYRLDFIMFDYSIDLYMQSAQQ